jgi:hypothetical protein
MAISIVFSDELNRISFRHITATRTKAALAATTLLAGLVLVAGNALADEDAAWVTLRSSGLPNIESLTYESDYTVFLAPGVPLGVHRAALRKLWSFPAFNQTDGLSSYAEDYSTGRDGLHDDARLVRFETR